MESQQVIHSFLNSRYRIVIERAASTKGTLGYKIEANNDNITLLALDIETLKALADRQAGLPAPIEEPKEKK